MKTWFSRHLQVLFATIGDLCKKPLTTIFIVITLAATLLVPAVFYVTIKSMQQFGADWRGRPQLSIFMDTALDNRELRLIHAEISLNPKVAIAEFISADDALQQFKRLSNLDQELAILPDNPLPASIIITPGTDFLDAASLTGLKTELQAIDGIEQISLDTDWINRFVTALGTLNQLSLLFSVLLSLATVLIIALIIRLLVIQKQVEIEVTKLIGGSNRFIARPFLYFGTILAACSSLLALFFLVMLEHHLAPYETQIATVYGQNRLFYRPQLNEIMLFFIGCTLIGWLSARFSVALQLRKIRAK